MSRGAATMTTEAHASPKANGRLRFIVVSPSLVLVGCELAVMIAQKPSACQEDSMRTFNRLVMAGRSNGARTFLSAATSERRRGPESLPISRITHLSEQECPRFV